MAQPCPSCAQPTSGRFCSHCGAVVDAACRECGTPLAPGGRFCNECGARAGAVSAAEPARRASSNNFPWLITGAALIALTGVLLAPRFLESDDAPPPPAVASVAAAGGAAPVGDARAVDLASMTPREAADRLFNRVMENVSAGDSAQATQFLPMAIAAYRRVPSLDVDGRYHLAVLHLASSDAAAAGAQADSIRAADPDHLFGLYAAARAARDAGDADAARARYREFLDRYDAQLQRQLPEYADHAAAMPGMKAEAEAFVTRGE